VVGLMRSAVTVPGLPRPVLTALQLDTGDRHRKLLQTATVPEALAAQAGSLYNQGRFIGKLP
jgi:hypothetical protein